MKKSKINIREIALPTEHGSWGFVLEPLVLALLVAYSFPGLMLALCTFFMFLSHQPIKNLFKKKNNNPYKKISITVLLIYFLIIFLFFTITFFQVSTFSLIPFAVALVVMVNYLITLYRQKNRELVSELSAPISISLVALSIVLFNGWRLEYVIAFWVILLARSIPTTFYVRTKILMIKKKPTTKGISIIQSIFLTLILLIFSFIGYSPYLSVIASLLILVRAYWELYISKEKIKIKVLGIREFIYGVLFVLIIALGYQLKL